MLMTIGALMLAIGATTWYAAIDSQPFDSGNIPGSAAATLGGGVLLVLTLLWPRSK